ncbi:MAG: DUF1566 domain-containing protein [Treponema sp.]|nr:DUF1566 domain-containing protein [Treponema sp.]
MKNTKLVPALALVLVLFTANADLLGAQQRRVNGTYRIGDAGPAGGTVFYDKGDYSGGWRYLEAAPVNAEITNVQWGLRDIDLRGTSQAVGSGRRNTWLILNRLNSLGEEGRAAQRCHALNVNGFCDWFLPSMDELNLMYVNLHRNGLGGFSDTWYWSSSQDSIHYAWHQNFGSGSQANHKYHMHSARAVRAF